MERVNNSKLQKLDPRDNFVDLNTFRLGFFSDQESQFILKKSRDTA